MKPEEIVKISLLCKGMNELVDPNRNIVDTNEDMQVTFKNGKETKLEGFLTVVCAIQALDMEIKM